MDDKVRKMLMLMMTFGVTANAVFLGYIASEVDEKKEQVINEVQRDKGRYGSKKYDQRFERYRREG